MRSVAFVFAGLAATVVSPAGPAIASTETQSAPIVAAAAPQTLGEGADLKLRFVQEDGPESGHVRVELTPETRPLTMMEARIAAERGFLAALDEKGLGDNLSRITVVVRLMPASHPDLESGQQVVIYRHTGGKDWSITAGE